MGIYPLWRTGGKSALLSRQRALVWLGVASQAAVVASMRGPAL
jgi:hypothetical protein